VVANNVSVSAFAGKQTVTVTGHMNGLHFEELPATAAVAAA
jgi:hypothetical protein